MNPVTDIVFSLTWILLLVWAVRSVISGWRSKPVRDFNAGRLTGTWTTEVKKPVHPEMVGVEPGEKLMGVTFDRKCNHLLPRRVIIKQNSSFIPTNPLNKSNVSSIY